MEGKEKIAGRRELYHDVDFGKYYLIQNGSKEPCDANGKTTKRFLHYVSGAKGSTERRRKIKEHKGNKNTQTTKQMGAIPNTLACTCAPLVKLNGYMQFPRPLSPDTGDGKIKEKSNKYNMSLLRTQKMQFFSKLNEDALTKKKDPRVTCSFFSQYSHSATKSKWTSSNSSRPATANTTVFRESIYLGDSGLPRPELMFGSSLKSHYMDLIKPTFATSQRRGESKPIERTLITDNEGNFMLPSHLIRSFHQIQNDLKKERIESSGIKACEGKTIKISSKGIFDVRTPTEGELYKRAAAMREKINPIAFAEEQKRDKRDLELLAKRKKQRELKNNAMLSIIRAQEKELKKEIAQKQVNLENPQPPASTLQQRKK